MDHKTAQKLISAIKGLGFVRNRDILGTYFSKTVYKISIMNHGHTFICYFNRYETNQWVVLAKSNPFSDYQHALEWALEKAKKAL